jgi:hypothetical protein
MNPVIVVIECFILHFSTSSAASSCDGGVRAQLDVLGQAGRVVNKTAAMICQYHTVDILKSLS